MAKTYYSIDSNDKLFCKCDGVTTSFVDSSSGAKTITANGNATQLPIKFNKSAGFFNGTTDYVVVPDSADWDFGTGDFTVEGFVMFNSLANQYNYVFARGATSLMEFYYDSINQLWIFNISGSGINGSQTATTNVWYHFMCRRESGTATINIDAVQKQTGSLAGSISSSNDIVIGAYNTPSNYLNGWVKEFRISNVARTVAVPTTQYTSDANTVLLMHFDTPATSPLAPAIAFDGTGDYLSLAGTATLTIADAVCLEGEFMFTSVTNVQSLIEIGDSASNGIELQWNNAGNLNARINGSFVSGGTFTPVLNRWYHLALNRDASNNVQLFITGQQSGSTGIQSGAVTGTPAAFIGSRQGSSLPFNGYAREIRVSNVSRYTTAFNPSQTGFTVDANTKLYIKGDENNGVTTFIDSETSPKTVTTNGNTVIKYTEDYRSCIFKDETGKFPYPQGSAKVDFFAIGQGVGYFDGSGDYLSVPDSDDWYFDGAMTLECYGRLTAIGNDDTFMGQFAGGATYWYLHYDTGLLKLLAEGGDGLISATATYTPPLNTWFHILVSRSGSNFYLFANGTLLATVVDANTFGNLTGSLYVGYKGTGSGSEINGLLDNIRISKGVARYTAAFNPPEFRSFIPRAIFIG